MTKPRHVSPTVYNAIQGFVRVGRKLGLYKYLIFSYKDFLSLLPPGR